MGKANVRNVGNGRLMGHVNYDAGLARYRQLLSESCSEVGKPARKDRQSIRSRRARKVAAVAAVALLVLSVGAAAMECSRCLLSPGYGGGGAVVSSVEYPSALLFAEWRMDLKALAWGGGAGAGSDNAVSARGFSQFFP